MDGPLPYLVIFNLVGETTLACRMDVEKAWL